MHEFKVSLTSYFLFASLIATSILPLSATAQSVGSSGGGGQNVTSEALSELMTTSTIRNLQSVQTECMNRDPIFQIDCLRQGLELVWRRLPYHGDYGSMRAAIQQSTNAVAKIVSSHADAAVPRLDSGLSSNPRFQARRHYTATRTADLGSAQSATRQVLNDLSDTLAQSSGKNPEWNENYTLVAKAVRQVGIALKPSA